MVLLVNLLIYELQQNNNLNHFSVSIDRCTKVKCVTPEMSNCEMIVPPGACCPVCGELFSLCCCFLSLFKKVTDLTFKFLHFIAQTLKLAISRSSDSSGLLGC